MQKVRDKIAEFLRYMAKKVGNYESLEMVGELYVVKNDKPILLGRKMITDNGLRAISLSLFSYNTSSINNTALDSGFSPTSTWGTSWRFGVFQNVGTGTNPESPTDTNLQNPIFSSPQQANQLRRVLDLTNGVLTLISSINFSFENAYDITEHGIWSAYNTSTFTLFDRTIIDPPIQVAPGDVLPFIYRLVIQR